MNAGNMVSSKDLQALDRTGCHDCHDGCVVTPADFTATGIRPAVLREIQELAAQYGVRKVFLFGSRARGDFHTKSDIDLASTGGDFTRFALDVDETTSTLLEYDIVNLDGPVTEDLRKAIADDGLLLYDAGL